MTSPHPSGFVGTSWGLLTQIFGEMPSSRTVDDHVAANSSHATRNAAKVCSSDLAVAATCTTIITSEHARVTIQHGSTALLSAPRSAPVPWRRCGALRPRSSQGCVSPVAVMSLIRSRRKLAVDEPFLLAAVVFLTHGPSCPSK